MVSFLLLKETIFKKYLKLLEGNNLIILVCPTMSNPFSSSPSPSFTPYGDPSGVSRGDKGGFKVELKAEAKTRVVAAAMSPKQHINTPQLGHGKPPATG